MGEIQASWSDAGNCRSRDTGPAEHEAQLEVLRRLGPEGRLRLAMQMSDDARDVTSAGIAARHPGYSVEQVRWALRRLILGDALFRSAWPEAPLLEP